MIPLRDQLNDYTVILEPDENTPEWWAGAPSVVRCEDGTFYLAARMREGNSPRGLRGYEVRILKSSDGVHFEPIHSIRREEVPIPGFERPSLLRDAETGQFKLYLCGPWHGGAWSIMKLDDVDDPANFSPPTCRPVLTGESAGQPAVGAYKDPFVIWTAGQYHMFVIGCERLERTFHFTSEDGESWVRANEGPALATGGWHNYYTRPACLVPMGAGWLFVYEGSHYTWHDPGYNIATGLAYSLDLVSFTDLTPEEPLLVSTTPGDCHTWRYSHWLRVEDELWAYAEVARPNNTNETRLFRLPC